MPGDPTEPDDMTCMAHLAAGDAKALDPLIRRHGPGLRRFLARRCRDPEMIDDIIQETFLALYKVRHRYREQDRLDAYLLRTALNLFANRLRREGRVVPIDLETLHALAAQSPRSSAPISPREAAERMERAQRVRQAFKQLDPQLSELIKLRLLDGVAWKDLAQHFHAPVTTLQSRVSAALDALRNLLPPDV